MVGVVIGAMREVKRFGGLYQREGGFFTRSLRRAVQGSFRDPDQSLLIVLFDGF